MKDKFSGGRLGDWTFSCMICGDKCWASESVVLSTYTGRGGLRVCLDCADPIDFGLVPYKVPAERPVPWAIDATNVGNPKAIYQQYPSFNYEQYDWTTTPQQILAPSWGSAAPRTWGASEGYSWGLGAASSNTNEPGGADLDEYGNPAEGQIGPDGTYS